MNVRRVSIEEIETVVEVKPRWRGLRASLRPLFLVSKAWGLAPLTIRAEGPVRSSKIFFTLFVAVFLTSTYIVAIIRSLVSEPSEKHVRYVAGAGELIFNRLCGILNHIFLIVYRDTFVSAVDSVIALDDEWKPNNGKVAIYVYLELAAMCVVVSAESYPIIDQSYRWPVLLFEIWHNTAIIHSLSVLILMWTNLVLSLAHLMETVTVELGQLYPEPIDWYTPDKPPAKNNWMFFLIENEVGQVRRNNPQLHTKSSETSVDIPALRKLHKGIHTALQKLQTAYGVPLTIGFSIVIVNTVIAVFELKHSYSKASRCGVIWALWSILLTCLMVMPCQMLLDKTQNCADILHGALQNDIQPQERQQLLDFSVQLLDMPLTCTSCNFFVLDNRRLISVLGTIVTYVIILSQFDSMGHHVNDGIINNATSSNCSALSDPVG